MNIRNQNGEIKMKAIFVMSSPFPYGEAFSSRARSLTKLLCLCGYQVHIIAPKSHGKEEAPELKEYQYSVEYIFDPKNCFTLSGIGTSKPYMEAINRYLSTNDVDLILSSSMIFVADKILKLANEFKIPYIIEQCEWYDESTFKFGKWNPYYREHIKRIKRKNKEIDGVISISRLFEEHYFSLNVPTIRIPTILDIKAIKYRIEKKEEKSIHIAFAGSLGKGKEKLAPIFKALTKFKNLNIKIVLDIYGPTEEQILNNIDNDNSLLSNVENVVNIWGRIPQEQVEEKIREADFTIFTRPIRRSSNAGFPTKFAESMSVGTPVITNQTGDIDLYLKDGVNGILLKNGTSQEILKALEKISSYTEQEYKNMRRNSRDTAEKFFDLSGYVDKMKSFLEEIR